MSLTRAIAALSLLAALAPAHVRGAAPELRALFPQQADIAAPGGRLVRLVLPPEVIAACRHDLSDVRIFDGSGHEVPFFVDSGPSPATVREVQRTFTPELLAVTREEVAREGAPNLLRERYEVSAPGESAAGSAWDLVVESPRPSFVRRVEVVDADGATIAAGSFFRLRQPVREKTRLTLPATSARRLAVILEGAEGFYLEPDLRFETGRTLAGAERAEVEVKEVSRTAGERRTRLELARPRGLVPDLLRLATTTSAFHREVEVWDEGPGAAGETLGRGVVFRVPALAPVEEVEIALSQARGDRLRLIVFDGDSPPLAELRVTAVVRRPALVFSLPAAEDEESAATLRFGGGRAYPPQYDLTALLPATGTAAEVGERLYDPTLADAVRLSAIVPNPHFDPAPFLAFAHRPGNELDVRRYRHRRELEVAASPEGLARLTLDLEDLARARPDLADLRVVDGKDRQWAYLLERGADEEVRPLAAAPPGVEGGVSRYYLNLPATPATLARLVLDTDAAFFDRDYELVGRRGKDEVVLARGRLVRRLGDPRPVTIACAATAIEELELRVFDGNDAPISLTSVRGYFPVPAVYFAAPAGRYALLLGDPEAGAPRYELERVRGLVLAVASTEAQAAALAENPAYRAHVRLASDEVMQQLLLWLALGAAVVVLTVLTLRLVRREERRSS